MPQDVLYAAKTGEKTISHKKYRTNNDKKADIYRSFFATFAKTTRLSLSVALFALSGNYRITIYKIYIIV